MKKVIYSIEGNIGSGKTMLLYHLQRRNPKVLVAAEPLDSWQTVSNYNLLKAFYAEPSRWAYSFQNYALLTRMHSLHQLLYSNNQPKVVQANSKSLNESLKSVQTKQKVANKGFFTAQDFSKNVNSDYIPLQNKLAGRYVFSERSVEADRRIFAQLLYKQGKMNGMEYQLYCKVFQHLSQVYSPLPTHKHIYLRTEPQVCFQRMRLRARSQEKEVDLNYLKQIHQTHQQWLGDGFVIDGTQEFQKDQKRLNEIIRNIDQWLVKSTQSQENIKRESNILK